MMMNVAAFHEAADRELGQLLTRLGMFRAQMIAQLTDPDVLGT